jgi:hypothetical protein
MRLGYLELPVGCAEGVLLNVKIRDGIAGTILYEANVAGLPVVVDGSFQLIQVYDAARGPRGIRLHRDHTYAFDGRPSPATRPWGRRAASPRVRRATATPAGRPTTRTPSTVLSSSRSGKARISPS